MRHLTPEEAQNLAPVTNGRETLASAHIKQLAAGDGLVISYAEWKAQYPPTAIAHRIAKKYGRKFATGRMTDGSGWVIKRIV